MVKRDNTFAGLYYDHKAARDALKLSRDQLDYLVDIGVVKPVSLPRFKKRFFVKSQIETLARQYEAMFLAATQPSLEYRIATVEDIKAENDLSVMVFGEKARNPVTQAARKHFIEVNPQVAHHLYDNGLLVASLDFVPVTPDAIEEFKQGKRGWLFRDEQIEQFTSDHPLQAIIIDFMTNPSVPNIQRKTYGMRLLTEFAGQLEKWGLQGVEITEVYASGGTAAGRRLLKNAGFQFLSRCEGERHIHVLDVTSSTIHLLEGYKAGLAQYKVSQQKGTETF